MEQRSAKADKPGWLAFTVLRSDPLVTFSTIDTGRICLNTILEEVPAIAEAPKALHLLRPTWHFERTDTIELAREITRARALVPRHHFLFLANYDWEASLVARTGIPAITANDGIFSDGSIWHPLAHSAPASEQHGAVYNARLEPVKRHELARSISRPLLIYAKSVETDTDADMNRVRSILPDAIFANHHFSGDRYQILDRKEVNRLYSLARVGLALSAEEGAMRASSEYLLAGLPIVSTHSIGGRDRYYGFPFVQIVPEDPAAVAAAVTMLGERHFDRHRIRNAFLQVQAFDRHNVLAAINRAGRTLLETGPLLTDFTPLVDAMGLFMPLDNCISRTRFLLANQKHADEDLGGA
ncbi:MAG: hypothetical protein KDJ48_09270 [Nitratireductor sp.]|nr:hypothetical protein [Nitratireductor sp.]